jgi:RimJ/RimL family protein N-acetyltransferase
MSSASADAPAYPIALSAPRVLLREIDPVADLEAAFRWASDHEFFRYLPYEVVETRAEEEAFLRGVNDAARESPRQQYHLGIVERATGELIGMVRLGIASPADGEGDLGYGIRRDRRGEGLATEAARVMLNFGFATLGLARVYATHHPENAASARVLAKLGMRREGVIRDHMFAHGAWRDSVVCAITTDEWHAARPAGRDY